MCCNISYGPWQTSAFMCDMEEASMDIAEGMDASGPILLFLWDKICKDKGWSRIEEQGPQARAAYFKDLPQSRAFTLKGPEVVPEQVLQLQPCMPLPRRELAFAVLVVHVCGDSERLVDISRGVAAEEPAGDAPHEGRGRQRRSPAQLRHLARRGQRRPQPQRLRPLRLRRAKWGRPMASGSRRRKPSSVSTTSGAQLVTRCISSCSIA